MAEKLVHTFRDIRSNSLWTFLEMQYWHFVWAYTPF